MSKEIVKREKNNNEGLSKLKKIQEIQKLKPKIAGKITLPRLFYQLVIFVLDGSRSMHSNSINGIPKGKEIDKTIKSVLKRLKDSKNSNSFDIAVFAFSNNHKNLFGIKELRNIDNDTNFNPYFIVENPEDTHLANCLIDVKNMISNYFEKYNNKNHQALVLLLSDGALNDYHKSLSVAIDIKKMDKVTLSVMYLESKVNDNGEYYSWDEKTGKLDYSKKRTIEDVKKRKERVIERFKAFATDETFFVNSIDPEEIRKHMIKSISSVSKID